MSMITPLGENEFERNPEVWERIEKLRRVTASKGPQLVNGYLVKDADVNTSIGRRDKTCRKYADEIMSIWLTTFEQ
jgi:hypothetical protein